MEYKKASMLKLYNKSRQVKKDFSLLFLCKIQSNRIIMGRNIMITLEEKEAIISKYMSVRISTCTSAENMELLKAFSTGFKKYR